MRIGALRVRWTRYPGLLATPSAVAAGRAYHTRARGLDIRYYLNPASRLWLLSEIGVIWFSITCSVAARALRVRVRCYGLIIVVIRGLITKSIENACSCTRVVS